MDKTPSERLKEKGDQILSLSRHWQKELADSPESFRWHIHAQVNYFTGFCEALNLHQDPYCDHFYTEIVKIGDGQ